MSDPAPDALRPDTELRRERHLRIRVGPDGIVYVIKHGREIACGPRGLAILDAFAVPRTLGEVLATFEAQGTQDWMDVSSAIVTLHREGVLVDPSTGKGGRPAVDGSFADPVTHAVMLHDRARTGAFIEAIDRVVQPDDVVVDVGTGTGILAMAAARRGARRVYAIEATGMAKVAAELVAVNGLSDRVTIVEGWSSEIELPERADVLVSEIIGEVPLDERVLESTLDARSRLLKPDARMIPNRLTIWGSPVAIEPEQLGSRIITPEAVEAWRSWYGLDFGPLLRIGRGLTPMRLIDGVTVAGFRVLGPPVSLAEIDLTTFDELQVATTVEAATTTGGALNGVVMYFDADLGGGVVLSSDPAGATEASSWRNAVWFLHEPIEVSAGDPVTLSLSYRVPGRQNGLSVSR
jgi:protein-L-isoaspartate O-methyltransferase